MIKLVTSVLFFSSFYSCFLNHYVEALLQSESIIGGDLSVPGQFKYMASVQANMKDLPTQHICGAGIIDERFVLTAAHCFISLQNKFHDYEFSVLVGTVDATFGSQSGIRVWIEKVYVPSDFRVRFLPRSSSSKHTVKASSDIAVAKLQKKLVFNDNSMLEMLELPVKTCWPSAYYGENPIIAGFGVDNIDSNDKSEQKEEFSFTKSFILKHAQTTVISNDKCDKEWTLPPEYMCAQVIQRDVNRPEGLCTGDSGSPLVLNGKTVIGIFSTGPITCDESAMPAVYTRVTSFQSFIELAKNNVNSPYIRFKDFDVSGK